LLGGLGNNGGPTQTMALSPGSPAIDQGKNFTTETNDQRGAGFPRVDLPVPNAGNGDGTDIGAFEIQSLPPSFTACPSNTTTSNDPGQCSASVAFTVTATGAPAPTVTCQIGATIITSPYAFPVGVSTVICTASSTAGSATCQFTVTVNDTQAPSPTCPGNINVTSNACQTVTYTTPSGSDNCPRVTVSCSPPSGTCFPVGTTTVTCTATDAVNLTTSCTFTVTVTPCAITCPANITDNVTPGTCSKVESFAPPTTTGQCGTVTCNPASGSSFPKGTTTVTCSTTAGPSCSFTVTIVDNESPTITCPANVTKGTDNGVCTAVVNYSAPAANDNCPLPPN